MDIHFYIKDNDEQYEVGHGLMPVVPRIGETIYLELTLLGSNPHSYSTTAFFIVKEVGYHVWNTEKIEDWMQPAPYSQGAISEMVEIIVEPINDETRAYVQRVIKQSRDNNDA